MDEVDRFLEAEQNLQDIATELKRMRDAGGLLENSQERANSVISSTETLVEEVRRFAFICKDIAAVGLSERLNDLNTEVERLARLAEESRRDTRGAIAELKTSVDKYGEDISNLETAIWRIGNKIEDQSQMSQGTDSARNEESP